MFHPPSGLAFAPLAEDLLFTQPVKEKCISGLPGSACDGLFSLPVDEKSIWFGLGWLAFGPRACPLGKGLTFHPACRGSLFQGSLEDLVMDFSPYLSTKSSFALLRLPSLGPSGRLLGISWEGTHFWYISERLKPGAPSHMGPARFNAAFTFAISSSESNLNAPRRRDAALLDNGAPTSGCCGGRRAGHSVD